MFDIFFIVSLFLFSVMCFFELVVFNEEILLALCFFSFIFFSFNSMGESIFDTFQSRATKFEEDLLVSFNSSKESLISKFVDYISSRGFVAKFKILSFCVTNYLAVFTRYYSYKWFALFLSASFAKLTELSVFESKLIMSFQEKSVSLLLYPLIFQSSKSPVLLLTSAATQKAVSGTLKKITLLSAISK
jgi:hypothetical protein